MWRLYKDAAYGGDDKLLTGIETLAKHAICMFRLVYILERFCIWKSFYR